jgi:hypothetical protein
MPFGLLHLAPTGAVRCGGCHGHPCLRLRLPGLRAAQAPEAREGASAAGAAGLTTSPVEHGISTLPFVLEGFRVVSTTSPAEHGVSTLPFVLEGFRVVSGSVNLRCSPAHCLCPVIPHFTNRTLRDTRRLGSRCANELILASSLQRMPASLACHHLRPPFASSRAASCHVAAPARRAAPYH